MQDFFVIKNYNICIVNFRSLINECRDDIYNELEKYDLCNLPKINRDVKNIILHHLFYKICKFFSEKNTSYKYVFYFDKNNINFAVCDFNTNDLDNVVVELLTKISRVLPLRFYSSKDLTYAQYTENFRNSDGCCKEQLLHLIAYMDAFNFEKFTFNKTLSFIKRNNLFLINDQLFTTLKAKQLLLK